MIIRTYGVEAGDLTKRRSTGPFTDLQVLNLVRAHPGENIYRLTELAKKEMGRGGECSWTTGKVQKAVQRLKRDGRLWTRRVIKGGRACLQVYSVVEK